MCIMRLIEANKIRRRVGNRQTLGTSDIGDMPAKGRLYESYFMTYP